MFGSKDKHKKQDEPTNTKPPSQSETSNQATKTVQPTHTNSSTQGHQSKKMETLISESCTIEGNIKSDESVKVDGAVKGDINVKETLIISASGQVTGNIVADSLVVFGTVHGDSELKSIHIQDGGHIDGNIKTQSLKVDPNATYNGVVTMTKESLQPASALFNKSSSKPEDKKKDKKQSDSE